MKVYRKPNKGDRKLIKNLILEHYDSILPPKLLFSSFIDYYKNLYYNPIGNNKILLELQIKTKLEMRQLIHLIESVCNDYESNPLGFRGIRK